MKQTERGLDRLTYFTDAIAAIAITLLVLPLVEPVADAAAEGESVGDFLRDHIPSMLSFALSFLLIARLWMTHHTVFEHVAHYSTPLRWLSIGWAFTIVLLPFPTAMTAQWSPEPVIIAFYTLTLLASSLTMTAIEVLVLRSPTIADPDNPLPAHRVRAGVVTSVLFALTFVLGTFVPSINYFAFLLLILTGPIMMIARRVRPPEPADV